MTEFAIVNKIILDSELSNLEYGLLKADKLNSLRGRRQQSVLLKDLMRKVQDLRKYGYISRVVNGQDILGMSQFRIYRAEPDKTFYYFATVIAYTFQDACDSYFYGDPQYDAVDLTHCGKKLSSAIFE